MKKLFVLVLALVLLCPSALALKNESLDDISFDDLVQYRKYFDMYLMDRPEFKQVTIPEGIYKIGVDIPAGDWNVIPVSGEQALFDYFEKLDQYGNAPDKDSYYMWDRIVNIPGYEVKSMHYDLKDGMYVRISMAPVIFSKYTGPSFSFD